MREEVRRLIELGPLPDWSAPVEAFERLEPVMDAVTPPVSDEEARELVRLFGPDDSYGAAWTLIHLIESAPGWPLWDCLEDTSNEWIALLRQRSENAQKERGEAPERA